MAQKAAPFLSFDHDPYAVINNGPDRLDRRRVHDDLELSLLTERQFATGGRREHPAEQLQLRAQLGQGRHRRLLGQDDVLRRRPDRPDPAGLLGRLPAHVRAAQRHAGATAGPPALPRGHLLHSVRHLRPLPPDRTRPQFYAASNAWQLSPTAGAGPQSQALLAENTYNNQGQLVSTTPARMSPQYQVYSLPGADPSTRRTRTSRSPTGSSRQRSRRYRARARTSTSRRGWWGSPTRRTTAS